MLWHEVEAPGQPRLYVYILPPFDKTYLTPPQFAGCLTSNSKALDGEVRSSSQAVFFVVSLTKFRSKKNCENNDLYFERTFQNKSGDEKVLVLEIFLQESFQRQCFEDQGSDLFCEKSARIATQTSSSPAAMSGCASTGRL